MALEKTEKEAQLKELTSIVTGIRLFNRDCGKGGQGIDDCKWMGTRVKRLLGTTCFRGGYRISGKVEYQHELLTRGRVQLELLIRGVVLFSSC